MLHVVWLSVLMLSGRWARGWEQADPVTRVQRDANTLPRDNFHDRHLWKHEYEEELNDAMLSARKRGNNTRMVQSVDAADTEAVIEKLMETITSSEKYLKKVDSIDFRLNRLDIEVHEKTNNILKYLTEIAASVKRRPMNSLEKSVEVIETEVREVKELMDKVINTNSRAAHEATADLDTEARFIQLDANMKNLMSGVESILTTISEVKNRQAVRMSAVKTEAGSDAPTAIFDPATLISELRRTLHEQRNKKCDCRLSGARADRSERYPTDCHEIQMQGFNVSGIYKIKPDDMEAFYVLCDLASAGGGWTVFHNRFDGTQDFFKGWWEYKNGFGNLAGEFWLGLDKLHYLTNQKLYELRVELETSAGQEAYAGYSVFTVGPEHEGYRISTLGTYHGSAGDSLTYHAGQKFSTLDKDNDEWKEGSCSVEHGGAWWYKECDKSNLNGKFVTGENSAPGQCMYWVSFKGPTVPLGKAKMMIRPLPASRPNDDSLRRNAEGVKPRAPSNPPAPHQRVRYEPAQQGDHYFNL